LSERNLKIKTKTNIHNKVRVNEQLYSLPSDRTKSEKKQKKTTTTTQYTQ